MSEETTNTGAGSEQTTGANPETQATPETAEKTFTQTDVDRIVGERLARERAKVPSEEELKGYRDWKASAGLPSAQHWPQPRKERGEAAQQTEAEKAAARETELTRIRNEAEALRRENAVIRAGVSADDADYVMFKVGKMDGDFEANLKTFLESDKRFTEPKTKTVPGTEHKSSKPDDSIKLTDRERAVMGLPPLSRG